MDKIDREIISVKVDKIGTACTVLGMKNEDVINSFHDIKLEDFKQTMLDQGDAHESDENEPMATSECLDLIIKNLKVVMAESIGKTINEYYELGC